MASTEQTLRQRMIVVYAFLAAGLLAATLTILPPATATMVCRIGGMALALGGFGLSLLTARTGFLALVVCGAGLTLVPAMMQW